VSYETKLTFARLLLVAFAISIYVLTIIYVGATAGEGYDALLRRVMINRGHLTEAEANSVLAMPREIQIDEEKHYILPGTFIHIHDDGQSGYTYKIPDTIWGEKVYPKEVKKK